MMLAKARAVQPTVPAAQTSGTAHNVSLNLFIRNPFGKLRGMSDVPAANKRKRSSGVDEASLPPIERARREEQRAKRQVALDARAGGGCYVSAKKLKRQERRKVREAAAAGLTGANGGSAGGEGGGGRGSMGRGRGGMARGGGDSGRGRGVGGRGSGRGSPGDGAGAAAKVNPEVVIIPIYWKAQKEAKIRVVTAAHAAHAALEAAGVRCEIDLTFEKTPGQKFAAWEFQGVLTRIEVGPRDAEHGTCTLARTDTPGTPARRRTGVSTRADLLVPAVRALLANGADALGELEVYSGPVSQPTKGKEGKRERAEVQAQAAAVASTPEALSLIGPAQPGTSGDDLAPRPRGDGDKAEKHASGKRSKGEVKF
jgi:hypothetical protein